MCLLNDKDGNTRQLSVITLSMSCDSRVLSMDQRVLFLYPVMILNIFIGVCMLTKVRFCYNSNISRRLHSVHGFVVSGL